MDVKLTTHVPYLKQIEGNYMIESPITVKKFLQGLRVKWNEDALVIYNGKISNGEEKLTDGDHIQLLIPLSGG